MAREKREEWTKRVERWRDSGLTAKEFATELGINVNSLTHWAWRFGNETRKAEVDRERPATTTHPVDWIEVAAPAKREKFRARPAVEEQPFEIVLPSGTTLRVPPRFESESLIRLLDAVGR
jgi:transposase